MLVPLLLAALVLQDPATGGGPPATPPPAPAPSGAPVPPPAAPSAPKAARARPVPAPPAPPATPRPSEPPRAQGPLRGSWPATPSGKSVTLQDEISLDDALEEIASAAGWNVVLNTGRTGNRTLVLRLRNVSVEEALRAALEGTGLVATRSGDTVVVAEPEATPRRAAPALSGFDQPTGKKITAEFKETPVADALRELAKAGGLSIVLPPGDHGTVSAQFRDVPVEDALRAVLAQANLSAEREGALLVVKPGGLPGFPFLPPGIGREARRAAEQAMREAEREMRRAERDAGRDADADSGSGRDRQQTGGDLVISAGEQVRDVNVVKGSLTLQGGAQARNISVVSGSVHLLGGAQARDINAVLGGVKLDGGASAREVVAVGGDVDVGPGAEVENDVISIGGRVRADPEADIGGSSRSIPFPTIPGVVGSATSHVFGGTTSPLMVVFETLVKFVVMFVLGLLVLSLFPRRLDAVAGSMMTNPLKSVLAGLLGTVTMPVLAVLLAVTVVGILLIPVQILGVIAAGVLGVTALVLHVGRSLPLPVDRRTAVIQLAVGTALFAVVTAIPFIGAMAWIAVWLLTFGAVLRTRFGQTGTAILPTTPVPPTESTA